VELEVGGFVVERHGLEQVETGLSLVADECQHQPGIIGEQDHARKLRRDAGAEGAAAVVHQREIFTQLLRQQRNELADGVDRKPGRRILLQELLQPRLGEGLVIVRTGDAGRQHQEHQQREQNATPGHRAPLATGRYLVARAAVAVHVGKLVANLNSHSSATSLRRL